ncbi:MAG: TnsA endonuclease N-terminal domain-containing protein [Planctomycetota bacterium]|nr:TnsA endonuclease N-terminal domain-containing protein [Planctomycetota bacterium]
MSTTLLVDPSPVATAPPASRASWSGQLRLGSCCVPVKAYPTISSTAAVSLRQLHAGCGEHIEYHKCCPKHGRVPADQIAKGYPYSAEQCVALNEEDLATLEPTDDKTIHLEHFLSPTEVDLTLLAGRSLYLAPAHPAAMKPFVVIRQALLRADKWALGRTVFSSKRQLLIDIQEQPLTIWYQWREQGNTLHIELLKAAPDVRPRKEANAGCSYIVPDFLVEMTRGQKRLVEVKPSDRLAKPLAQRKLSVARQYAATEGTSPCSLPAWNGVHNQKRLPSSVLLATSQLVCVERCSRSHGFRRVLTNRAHETAVLVDWLHLMRIGQIVQKSQGDFLGRCLDGATQQEMHVIRQNTRTGESISFRIR